MELSNAAVRPSVRPSVCQKGAFQGYDYYHNADDGRRLVCLYIRWVIWWMAAIFRQYCTDIMTAKWLVHFWHVSAFGRPTERGGGTPGAPHRGPMCSLGPTVWYFKQSTYIVLYCLEIVINVFPNKFPAFSLNLNLTFFVWIFVDI